jgi:NAD(P)-dependent dehydrogenase (short-subunit alcohol dehydrogenase family)
LGNGQSLKCGRILVTLLATTRVRPATVIVTGAASGIGCATAAAFARAGASVFAVDRDSGGLAELAGRYDSVVPVAADVCAGDLPQRLAELAPSEGLDVLAHVAGCYRRNTVATADPAALDELFALHVVSLTLLTQALLPSLEKAGGAVVTVSSTFGHRASRTASAYAASKAAVESLTRTWAIELAPRGIRVNAVAPGPTDTGILAAAGMSADAVREQRDAERNRVPLGRIGEPDEIAEWIVTLADPGWMTGQVISVDGGLSLG